MPQNAKLPLNEGEKMALFSCLQQEYYGKPGTKNPGVLASYLMEKSCRDGTVEQLIGDVSESPFLRGSSGSETDVTEISDGTAVKSRPSGTDDPGAANPAAATTAE